HASCSNLPPRKAMWLDDGNRWLRDAMSVILRGRRRAGVPPAAAVRLARPLLGRRARTPGDCGRDGRSPLPPPIFSQPARLRMTVVIFVILVACRPRPEVPIGQWLWRIDGAWQSAPNRQNVRLAPATILA